MVLKALFLLSAVIIAGIADNNRMVLYPKYKSGVLICYKDQQTDGGAFWTYANDKQRRPYIYHCPSSLSAWCVTKTTGELSIRGCSGPTGVNKAGCFHVTDQQNVVSKVCLCNRDYCNTAAATVGQAVPPLLAFIIVAANN